MLQLNYGKSDNSIASFFRVVYTINFILCAQSPVSFVAFTECRISWCREGTSSIRTSREISFPRHEWRRAYIRMYKCRFKNTHGNMRACRARPRPLNFFDQRIASVSVDRRVHSKTNLFQTRPLNRATSVIEIYRRQQYR